MPVPLRAEPAFFIRSEAAKKLVSQQSFPSSYTVVFSVGQKSFGGQNLLVRQAPAPYRLAGQAESNTVYKNVPCFKDFWSLRTKT